MEVEQMKPCTKCGTERPIGDFYRCASSPDGFEWRCKFCKVKSAVVSNRARQAELNAKARERYAGNADLREVRRIALSEWRKNNPEKVRNQRKRASSSLLKRRQAGDGATLQMLSDRYKRRYQNPISRAKRISDALDYAKRHPDRARNWRLKSEQEARMLLKDSYIRKTLNVVGAPTQMIGIPEELISMKRAQLKIFRVSKTIKKTIKEMENAK